MSLAEHPEIRVTAQFTLTKADSAFSNKCSASELKQLYVFLHIQPYAPDATGEGLGMLTLPQNRKCHKMTKKCQKMVYSVFTTHIKAYNGGTTGHAVHDGRIKKAATLSQISYPQRDYATIGSS
ncbi:hypothetical protein PQU95_13925 [Vogesella sp. DC21W]|uniref:Uncharacterized protein n=1 Tax=Vogesella aquatica TaxID=2984206 RepID=A0ABT5J1C0_9NEIS|nr:hypothetical protein [Vogesella aquatica]MDC7718310.1 hypothetical protein [Vogesella aquatica]